MATRRGWSSTWPVPRNQRWACTFEPCAFYREELFAHVVDVGRRAHCGNLDVVLAGRPRATARKLNRPTISACRKQFSAALTHDLHPEHQRRHEKTRRSARNRQVQQPGWLHRSPRHRVRPDERSPPATPSTLFSGSAGTTLHPSVVSMTGGPVKSAEPWGFGCSPLPLPRAVVSCLGVERR